MGKAQLRSSWSVADAKNKLSELLNLTDASPQTIVRRGKKYVVMTEAQIAKSGGKKKSLAQHLLAIPKIAELDLSRDTSTMREVDL